MARNQSRGTKEYGEKTETSSFLGNNYIGHLPTVWVLTLFTAQDGKNFREREVHKWQRAGRCSSISMSRQGSGTWPWSLSSQWHNYSLLHLARLTICLSPQKPTAVFPEQQPLRGVLIYWIKYMQLQTKEKKTTVEQKCLQHLKLQCSRNILPHYEKYCLLANFYQHFVTP